MREEFLEPMPTPQTNAKLLMGRKEVACFIVEVTAEGFRVAVPGIEHYEGDPKLTLVTRSTVYPVRLVLQEPHMGGYSYRLQRMDEVVRPRGDSQPSFRLSFLASHCCAAGLISLIVSSCFCIIPVTSDRMPLLTRRGLRYESLGTWSPSIAENDRVPPGISVDKSQLFDDVLTQGLFESSSDLRTISVSMIAPASGSTVVDRPLEQDQVRLSESKHGQSVGASGSKAKPKKEVSLKSLLEEGQVGRVQIASPAFVSWLFGSSHSPEVFTMRLSDAAVHDLKQFELGLKVLPSELSSQAITSLKRSLSLANSNQTNTHIVSGIRDVFVINSDDANIYYRKVHGQLELVRVLPLDFSKAE